MHRVARSRRHLAGLLRRRPILDSVVAGPDGPDGRWSAVDVRTILESTDAAPATEDDVGCPHHRGSSRI